MDCFLNIPRFPEDPPLEGVPRAACESVLLTEDLGRLLPRGIGDIEHFRSTPSERRRFQQAEIHKGFLRNPCAFEGFFDFLKAVENKGESNSSEVRDYRDFFFEHIDRYTRQNPIHSVASLSAWLELYTRSSAYHKQAREVLSELFSAAMRRGKTVDLMYDFAQAVLSARDPEVFARGMQLLCFHNDTIPCGSKGHEAYILTTLTPDDEQLRKLLEIDAAIYKFGPSHAEEQFAAHERFRAAFSRTEIHETAARRFCKENPQRALKLDKLYSSPPGLLHLEEGQKDEFPYRLIVYGGPVKDLLNGLLARENDDHVCIWLPGRNAALHENGPELSRFIKEELCSCKGQNTPLCRENEVATLFYLTPGLDRQQLELLLEDVMALRTRVLSDRSTFLNPRGDRIIITAPELTELGYRAVTFRDDESGSHTDITLEVGNFCFALKWNRDFLLCQKEDGAPFNQPPFRRAFLSHMLLSHLYELICEESVEPLHGSTRVQHLEHELRFKGRRPHLRRLPPGQSYSESARSLALSRQKGFDLARHNMELGLTAADGMVTYVKAADPDETTTENEPFISRTPHAFERCRRLIGGDLTATVRC